ncbi:histidine phosphatase superfamily [Papiliotrema laurentii]|uniref:Histidine phosphatase superfamily n=1 Tax=Papiliotrema laurentii TaxID=5418 RepID=A0AAD9L7J5_PAPLA|nr:histidine phosphatase superfamily [Papiliotrema laurentii]
MSFLPAPNSRTPLLAAHSSAQPSSSQSRSSRARSPNPSARPILVPTVSHAGRTRRKRSPNHRTVPAILIFVLVGLTAMIAWDVSSYGDCYFQSLCNALGDGTRLDRVWWENSGAYAPWRSGGPGGGKRGLPRGCEINQVTLLHRHAARYPTTSAGKDMQRALDKIANRKTIIPRKYGELSFLSKADLAMTGWKFDELLNQGRKAAWRSGRELKAVYHPLIQSGEGLFVRSSGSHRVVESAGYWLEGFYGRAFKLRDAGHLPLPNVTIPEGETSNNTLSVHNCPAFNNQDDQDLSMITNKLITARDRLNAALRPQPPLDTEDLTCLADLCPYDSQVAGEDWEAWSRWCGIFTRAEWDVLGYRKDARRYYEAGEGSPYGKTMGAGWVNELLARLTDSAPEDSTTTNRTLDADESTFPQGGKRFFADFGHDNEMIEILAAMGLLSQQRPLPIDSVPDKRTFITSEIIPFGSRIIFERIGCRLGDWEPDPEAPAGDKGDGRKNYVRVFINDVLVPIEDISCQQSGFVEHKMCEVELFLESQAWAREEVDWGVCQSRSAWR